ncbi:unnamed protein product [Parascedosporium putredinis]|uniref:Uncharacterized protein n=1 Tax=Parascedosporium putredinis TaxID=1442378 RepID=A0A9P1HCH3_9PEZI|nr:unnamed protein product [Parascedosporium putredinis]CAI8003270.1 unnamed protein product [Parascedosporium putredinis]
MRFQLLAALFTAVLAAAGPLGKLPSEEAKEMKAGLAKLAEVIDDNDCSVGKAQLQVFKHSLMDTIVEGHIEGEKQLVKYLTREEGQILLDKISLIREAGDAEKAKAEEDRKKAEEDKKFKFPRELNGDDSPRVRPLGSRIAMTRGRLAGGGSGSGRRPRDVMSPSTSSMDKLESLHDARDIRLTCGATRRVLKVVRNFVSSTPKPGKSTDGKSVFYIYPKEEADFKRRVVKAATARG